MKRLIAALAFMLLASPAFATTTVNTSMVFVNTTGQLAGCEVVNVGKKPLSITVSITAFDGTILYSPGAQMVLPGQGGYAFVTLSTERHFYCSFLFSGSAKDIRGSLEVLDSTTGNPLVTLPAS